MENYCNSCPVPDIKARIEAARQAAQTANANATASESPTQAESYQWQAKESTTQLRQATQEFDTFSRSGRMCQSCKL